MTSCSVDREQGEARINEAVVLAAAVAKLTRSAGKKHVKE